MNKTLYFKPTAAAIVASIPDGLRSQSIDLLLRASKLNTDERDREIANRELDIFIEKLPQ